MRFLILAVFSTLQSNKEPFICAKISIRDVRLSTLKVRNRLVHFCISWDLWTLVDPESFSSDAESVLRLRNSSLVSSFLLHCSWVISPLCCWCAGVIERQKTKPELSAFYLVQIFIQNQKKISMFGPFLSRLLVSRSSTCDFRSVTCSFCPHAWICSSFLCHISVSCLSSACFLSSSVIQSWVLYLPVHIHESAYLLMY